jgi:sn-glycerol 3-phosphate transport system ATP-binding protein
MNIVDAQVKDGKVYLGDQPVSDAIGKDGPVKFGVRPEHLDQDDAGPIAVKIQMAEPLGANTLLHGRLGGAADAFTVSLQGVHLLPEAGAEMRFRVQPGKGHLFDIETGVRRT